MTPFQLACQSSGIPVPIKEHIFAPPRKWRFDWAWPADDGIGGIALEIEGAIWRQGRHTRGSGFAGDMEKYNEAAILGWRLIRCTPKQFESGEALTIVMRAFGK